MAAPTRRHHGGQGATPVKPPSRAARSAARALLLPLCAALIIVRTCPAAAQDAPGAERGSAEAAAGGQGEADEKTGFWASAREQFAMSGGDEVEITHLLSLDFNLLLTQLIRQGIGFGVQYERQIYPHYALKGYFGHAVINTGYRDYYCLTVSFGLFAEWYPLSRQMRKLYVGAGGYFDYLGYISGNEDITEDTRGTMLSFIPQVGYKFSLPFHLLLDVSVAYKLPYSTEVEAYGSAGAYLRRGFQYGLGLKRVIKQ